MKITILISALMMFSATGMAEAFTMQAETAQATVQTAQAAQVADTSQFAALDARLDEYLDAIKAEPAEVQEQEADFLIEVCSDSLIRQRTALRLYGHFLSSPVMGEESVAIHLYDRWFATGKVRMKSESDLFAAKFFAETNRQSLIGCRAPEIELSDAEGNMVRIMTPEEKGWRVIFFYDTDCAKCRLESMVLKSIFEDNDYPITFYAVYIGTDKEAWSTYIQERLDFRTSNVRAVHLWDPELKADIGYRYGVFQTPKIFLVNPSGTVIGRGLDAPALEQLIKAYIAPKDYEYGSDGSVMLYDKVFAPLLDSMTCSTVSEIGSYIEKSTLEQLDTAMFRQMTGDLLYYITSQRTEGFRCGTEAFVDKYILSRSDIWNTAEDSLKVVGLAEMLKVLSSLAPTGGKLPSVKVHGTLKTSRAKGNAPQSQAQKPSDSSNEPSPGAYKSRSGIFNLSSLRSKGRTVIIFHTEGCSICKHELSAADSLLTREKSLKVLEINMDELFSSYPDEADTLMQTFDLSALPFILEADSKGRITRKYISL